MISDYIRSVPNPRNSTDSHESPAHAHARNFSTLSNATLFTSSSHSQPTDPLLQPTVESTRTEDYYDQITRPSRNDPGTPRLRWNEPLAYIGTQDPMSEKSGLPTRVKRSFFRHAKFLFKLMIGLWATYNTIRYSLTFLHYNDPAGQIFCLALGTSTGIASVLILSSMLLSILNGKILFQDDETLFIIQALLQTIFFFCLLGPAVVNVALVFLWKDSQNPNFDLRARCQYDVDVVWSLKRTDCSLDKITLSWTPWILLSSFRLALTILIIYIYQKLFWFPDRPQQNSHHVLSNSRDGIWLRECQPSESTLIGDPFRQQNRVRLTGSSSSETSVKVSSAEHASFGRSILCEAGTDRDVVEFADRFRSLVLEITQETEAAVSIARSDGTSSPEIEEEYTSTLKSSRSFAPIDKYDTYNSTRNDNDNVFSLQPLPPTLGYNEFGLPYPPVNNVRMLNGLVRRMPTIESISSWEVNSSLGASNHDTTKTTLLTFTTTDVPGSRPASRANSLCLYTETPASLSPISATSESGEHLGRTRQCLSASCADGAVSINAQETRSSGSCSTTPSYRTTAMGGTGPSTVYHDGILVQPIQDYV